MTAPRRSSRQRGRQICTVARVDADRSTDDYTEVRSVVCLDTGKLKRR